MHRNTKHAQTIISLQESDGKWGCFHSLSKVYDAKLTTEQALRRLEILGYTIEDECIARAVEYMTDCLLGRKAIPDPREKVHDWDVFSALILSTWIRRFTQDVPAANAVAEKWAELARRSFASGSYDHDAYVEAYRDVIRPSGGRLIGFLSFYPVSLLAGLLDEKTEDAFVDYVLSSESGIYYIYDRKLTTLPERFEDRSTSYYLAAIELLARYPHAKRKLSFVVDWLSDNRGESGWDMGKSANDKLYFPLSDDWRKSETRIADCTERIGKLITAIRG